MAGNIFLMQHQSAFMQSYMLYPELRFFMMVAGYGAGKSRTVATCIMNIAQILNGKKDTAGDGPRVVVGGATIAHFLTTTMIYVFEALDRSDTPYLWDKKLNILKIGSVQFFVVSLSSPGSIKGQDACMCLADEADDLTDGQNGAELTLNAIKALNERARQKIIGFRAPAILIATTSQGQKGLYQLYCSFLKSGQGFVVVRGRTADNKHNDPTYVKSLYKTYTKDEADVYLEGKFVALRSGRVCGDFDWDKNFINIKMDRTVSPGEHIIWSQDFNNGYHRGCAVVERNGVVFVIKEYEFPDIRVAPYVVREDFPENKITWVPDATAKDTIMSFRKELKKYNIRWAIRSKNPSVEDTLFLVNKLLYTRRLIITAMAKETAEDMARALRGKNNEVPKGVGPLSPIHRIDGIRMAAFYLAMTRRSLRDIRMVTLDRHMKLAASKEIDEENEKNAMIEELPGGYTEVSAGAL